MLLESKWRAYRVARISNEMELGKSQRYDCTHLPEKFVTQLPLHGGCLHPAVGDGRGDTIRTCDLMLPKHARYQLRHAPT